MASGWPATSTWTGRRVLELGCGLGLVAVTAALAGAPWDLVLAADVLYEPRNVPVLRGATKRLQTNTNWNEFG